MMKLWRVSSQLKIVLVYPSVFSWKCGGWGERILTKTYFQTHSLDLFAYLSFMSLLYDVMNSFREVHVGRFVSWKECAPPKIAY